MSFCSKAGRGDELLRRFASLNLDSSHKENGDTQVSSTPSTTSTITPMSSDSVKDTDNPVHQKDLSVLILAMRKLREALLASHRLDTFSTQCYIFMIRFSIQLKHMQSYHPALLHLLYRIHPVLPLPSSILSEFISYLVLDLACRQNDLATAHQARIHFRLKDRYVDGILKSLVMDDYEAFWRAKKAVDGLKARLMEWKEAEMRRLALKCLGRTYFAVEVDYLEKVTGSRWGELVKEGVGWELQGSKVVIRKPKGV